MNQVNVSISIFQAATTAGTDVFPSSAGQGLLWELRGLQDGAACPDRDPMPPPRVRPDVQLALGSLLDPPRLTWAALGRFGHSSCPWLSLAVGVLDLTLTCAAGCRVFTQHGVVLLGGAVFQVNPCSGAAERWINFFRGQVMRRCLFVYRLL